MTAVPSFIRPAPQGQHFDVIRIWARRFTDRAFSNVFPAPGVFSLQPGKLEEALSLLDPQHGLFVVAFL